MELVPIDDPFAAPTLTPVSDPFAAGGNPSGMKLEPIEDPFPKAAEPAKPAPPPDEGASYEITKGFKGGVYAQPKLFGHALEGIGDLTDSGTLQEWGGQLSKWTDADLKAQAPRVAGVENIRTDSFGNMLQDVGSYAGYAVGQTAASILPTAAGAVVGKVVGAPLGPIGSTITGVGGATIPAFMQNYGDVRSSSLEDKDIQKLIAEGKLSRKTVSKITAMTAPALTALDLIPDLLAMKAITSVAKRELGKRIASGIAKGAIAEGTTEGLQEVTSQWARDYLGSNKTVEEKALAVINNFLGGAIGGGAIRGAVEALPKQQPTPASPEEIQNFITDMMVDLKGDDGKPIPGLRDPPKELASRVEINDVPLWFSPLRAAVESSGMESASAEQWNGFLRNQPGIKPEELEWTGMPELLAPGKKLSKNEILAHLDENAIKVTEVERLETEPGMGFDGGQTYSPYVAPGKQEVGSYRELLLTLPVKEDDRTTPGWYLKPAPENFRTPHFKTPNVLVHVRMTERVDQEGRPYVFVEEIQSDWHQKGRRVGYNKPVIRDDLEHMGGDTWRVISNNTPFEVPGFGRNPEIDPLPFANNKVSKAIPDAPFKTAWPELAVKRMIRWASDQGIQRIAFPSPYTARFSAGQENGLEAAKQAGMNEFYGKMVPSIVRKWAKKIGGTTGTLRIAGMGETYSMQATHPVTGGQQWVIYNNRTRNPVARFARDSRETAERTLNELNAQHASVSEVMYLELPKYGFQQPMPLFQNPGGPAIMVGKLPDGTDMKPLADIFQSIMRKFGLEAKIDVVFGLPRDPAAIASLRPDLKGRYTITVDLARHKNVNHIYSSLMHEFGHVVLREKWKNAPVETQLAIRQAYENWIEGLSPSTPFSGTFQGRQAGPNVISDMWGQPSLWDKTLQQVSPEFRNYWLSFDEWFAENTAAWATSSEKPLSIVDKFFASLGKTLRDIFESFSTRFGQPTFNANAAMKDWLDSFVSKADPTSQDVAQTLDIKTYNENQAAIERMSKSLNAVPRQQETASARAAISQAFGNQPIPPEVKTAAALADRFSWFSKLMLSLPQVAKRNPHLADLARYTETIRIANLDTQVIRDAALRVAKDWRGLGKVQADALGGLIDDLINQEYLTDDEFKNNVRRQPTAAELDGLINKHKLSAKALEVYRKVFNMFDKFLDRTEQLQIADAAAKIQDPARLIDRVSEIKAAFNEMRKAPYFPAFRFGEHTVTVKDANGKIVFYATVERRGLKSAERVQKDLAAELKPQLQPGETITLGVLPPEVGPFKGMPPQLLDLMADKLSLTDVQRDALDAMRFQYSPRSFKHHLTHKRVIPGYSDDFLRSFATFFFHGASYYARTKYADPLRTNIRDLRDQGGTRKQQISNYMSDHFEEWNSPKADWAVLRSVAFLWALAFSPAAAALNLTQTFITTFPFLGSKFGDVKATAAITNAAARYSSFYKRGKYEGVTDGELKAIGEGIKQGIITEAMAPELAALTDGRNLLGNFGNVAQQAWTKINEMGSLMFEMAEQFNRRVAFRAAYNLAISNPGAKYVQEAVRDNSQQFDKLIREGWSDQEARAFVVAADVVRTTQYEYSKAMQPRFMRGKLRTVFIFKTFVQNTLFFLWNYPSSAIRSLLIMGLMGGMMGLPGAEDIKKMIKALWWQFGNKDLDIELELRKYIKEVVGAEWSDRLLHGMARNGFGVPAIMEMMGQNWFPNFDRSRAIGLGQISPLDVEKLFGPHREGPQIADAAQQASGAVFGTAFNIVKAINNHNLEWNDPKRWERAVPRAIGSGAKAWRSYSEGRERTPKGATVITYDPRDPQQMMEIIGIAMGYQPHRLSVQWDRKRAEYEVLEYWNIRKQGLLKQMDAAVQAGDPAERERVVGAIKKFNNDLPAEGKAKSITSDTINRSIKARGTARAKTEAGIPQAKQDIGMVRAIQELFPEAPVGVRKVR